MIRFYAYYSCGGYKDMYLGHSEMGVDKTYYLPLLPIWEEEEHLRQKDAERLERAKSLTLIQVITDVQSFGFPQEADLFFSHGAYKAIYRSLEDGGSCLGLTGLNNGEQDEFGRGTPFSMVITAEREDTKQLDALAVSCMEHPKEMWEAIGNLIGYSPEMNGISFNLNEALSVIRKAGKEISVVLDHHSRRVNYILLSSLSQLSLAIKEQQLNHEMIDYVCALQGEKQGNLAIIKNEKSTGNKSSIKLDVTSEQEDKKIIEVVANSPEVINKKNMKQPSNYIESEEKLGFLLDEYLSKYMAQIESKVDDFMERNHECTCDKQAVIMDQKLERILSEITDLRQELGKSRQLSIRQSDNSNFLNESNVQKISIALGLIAFTNIIILAILLF